jgi:hypothetical protein
MDSKSETKIRRTHCKNCCKICMNLKKAYDSVRRAVLYNILVEFGMPLELFAMIKISFH